MRPNVWFFTAAIVVFGAAAASAQGQQYGTLSGRVASTDNLPLPGVTVTASSDALQGTRAATTDINGIYALPGLAPGQYLVRFELDKMTTVDRRAVVGLGALAVVDQQLALAPVKESVDVRGAAPTGVTSHGTADLQMADVAVLPVGRTPFLMTELTPGVTDNTPSASQVTISGAFAYDNVFLMNGVDINDNVLGTPNNLFIEDAVQEVQVLSSGISPEYGRFSGGVVNVITRSGGNALSGAFRMNLTNPAWSAETPLEKSAGVTRGSKLSPAFEATAGGPLRRDRLWFFGGARVERTTTQSVFAQTRIPFTSSNDNTRYEGKLTGTVVPGHTLQGSVIDNDTDLRQPSLGASIDPATMTTPSTPNRIAAATWHGVLGPRTFAEAQLSQKTWRLENAGGTSAAIVDSPFLTRGASGIPANLQYNGPYFDSTDPEARNNRQFTASLSQMLSSRRLGTHELKTGFEYFTSTRVGGNSQSLSGYVFQADYKVGADGRPELDSQGRLIPRFVPGTSRLQTWMPLRGSSIDVATASAYMNDHWTAAPRLTLDLGARYERVRSQATGDISGAHGDTIVPRLGAAYDLTADGRTVAQATYAHYAGKYNDVQFSRNSNVGNADRITGSYIGPAGEGRDFAAGFDAANYQTIAGTFPTANVFFDENLESPRTREFTAAIARDLGHIGWVRATYVRRHATGLSRTSSRWRRDRRWSSATASTLAPSTMPCTGTPTRQSVTTRRSSSSLPLVRCRICRSAASGRCNSRTTARSKAKARAARRSPRSSRTTRRSTSRREISPAAGWMISSATRFVSGPAIARSSDASARSIWRRSIATTRAGPTASWRQASRCPLNRSRGIPDMRGYQRASRSSSATAGLKASRVTTSSISRRPTACRSGRRSARGSRSKR